jgi:hypothetical protein
LDGPTLPTRIGAYRAYGQGLPGCEGPVRCLVRGRLAGAHQTLCDIAFVDDADTVVAELLDVEMTRVQDGRA